MAKKRTEGFLAIDGESVDVNGEHRYVMLCTSGPAHIFNESGLSSHECFDFLIEQKKKHPRRRMVAFGLNYDVNMMLRDVPRNVLVKLWREGSASVMLRNGVSYRMEWLPGKCFKVCRLTEKKWAGVSDTFGFFQCSFVKALESWNIPDPGGHIARMKQERGRFKLEDKDQILEYCLAECELLVKLMLNLEDAMAQATIKPSSWMGAGSVAAAILRKESVNEYRRPDEEFPREVYEAIMHSYFGGRIEVFLQGSLTNLVAYDIRSAYPHQALSCPILFGEWRKASEYHPEQKYAVWRVEWDVPKEFSVMPFPLRQDGKIHYPQNGRGWYHANEVRTAMRVYPDFIRVLGGYVFVPHGDRKPFSFLRDYYETRAEAKRQGLASEKAYKLGINAVYGKLAQGRGYKGKIPPFRSFYWAGMITAGTRARLLDMASENLRGVVSMATDGIVFTGDPELVESDKLGGLEKEYYDRFFIAQPGIYYAEKSNGEKIRKSRGFFTREIDFEGLEEGWLKMGPRYAQEGVCACTHVHEGPCPRCDCQRYESPRRFIGLGSALMRSDMDVWRCWVPSDRRLSLSTARKFYDDGVSKGKVMRLFPPRFSEIVDSEVYTPKSRGVDMYDDLQEIAQGLDQPLLDF